MEQVYCANDNHQCGIYLKYYCDTLGKTACGILIPNTNFKYPEVYQRLCELICEEHNKRLTVPLAGTTDERCDECKEQAYLTNVDEFGRNGVVCAKCGFILCPECSPFFFENESPICIDCEEVNNE